MNIYCKIAVSFLFMLFMYVMPVSAGVQGHVFDSKNNPIENALVTFTDESTPYNSYSAVTNEDGLFEIDFSVSVREEAQVQFRLGQNYPNPFNPSTMIPFSIDSGSHVSLTIYNIMGQKVGVLLDQYMSAGEHSAGWNGLDEDGNHASAGIYFYHLKAGQNVETGKMLLLDGGRGPVEEGCSTFHSAKISSGTSYTVTITHNSLVTYREEGVFLTDGVVLDYLVSRLSDTLGIEFISITGWNFEMGDELGNLDEDCRPIHSVRISDYEMSANEITNAQFVKFLTAALASGDITVADSTVTGTTGDWADPVYLILNDYDCEIRYNFGLFTVEPGKENRPVIDVTWFGAKSFAVYYGLDLPTEAEWEFAARSGTRNYQYSTNGWQFDKFKGNYDKNVGHTTNVGSYPANLLGLFDMSGNVWEWCHCWYGAYTRDMEINPTGPQKGLYRVIRGGCWYEGVDKCRTSCRGHNLPSYRNYCIGFRVVRRPGGVIY